MNFSFSAYPGIEKILLLSAAFFIIGLFAVCIRLFRRASIIRSHQIQQNAFASESDPNSLSYSGVGPGAKWFRIYVGGVRVAHDRIESE